LEFLEPFADDLIQIACPQRVIPRWRKLTADVTVPGN
jgi:hypothetical protein